MNLSYIFNQGDPVLLATFLLLASMSLASWYIIFWKGWKFYKERKILQAFRKSYINVPEWPRHASLKQTEGSIAILVAETEKLKPLLLTYSQEEGKEILSTHLSQGLDVIRVWLDKGLTVLASVGSSAPFIGLFGTVWGIYGALTKIASEGNASLNVVAGPMGEALVATAVGLFAAIPAVLAYNALVRMNRLFMQDLRHIAEQITLYYSVTPVHQENANDVVKRVRGVC